MLYDTGADISCISEKEFRQIPIENRPPKLPQPVSQQFKSASGDRLQVKGLYNLPVRLLGKNVTHTFCVIKQLSEPAIIGSDFIHLHQLAYCPMEQNFFYKSNDQWKTGIAAITTEMYLAPFSVNIAKINLITEKCTKPISRSDILVDIANTQHPLLSGGPGIVQPDPSGQAFIELRNCGPEEITLSRGTAIGSIENAASYTCEELQPKVINATIMKIASERINTPPSPENYSL